MQIIGIISGDDFLSDLNISIPTDDLIERLEDFVPFWFRDHNRDGSRQKNDKYCKSNWANSFPVNMTRILWKTGFCYTFNMPKLKSFYNFDAVHKYLREEQEIIQMAMTGDETKNEYVLDYPVKVPNFKVGLHMEYRFDQWRREAPRQLQYLYTPQHNPSEIRDGFRFTFHDPFELPSISSYQFYAIAKFTKTYLIAPEVMKLDESMLKHSLAE